MDEDYFVALMAGFPLFAGFTEAGARDVVGSGEVVRRGAGEVVFEEGGEPDSAVLILEGEVEVYVERDGRRVVLARPGPGAMLGEMAVLCEIPRSASVCVGGGGATLLTWDAKGFRRLLLRDPALARGVFGAALKTMIDKEQALIEEMTGGGG